MLMFYEKLNPLGTLRVNLESDFLQDESETIIIEDNLEYHPVKGMEQSQIHLNFMVSEEPMRYQYLLYYFISCKDSRFGMSHLLCNNRNQCRTNQVGSYKSSHKSFWLISSGARISLWFFCFISAGKSKQTKHELQTRPLLLIFNNPKNFEIPTE